MSLQQSDNYQGRELPYRLIYISVVTVLATCVVFGVVLFPVIRGFTGLADAANNQDPLLPELQERPTNGPLLQPKPEAQWLDYERLIERELEAYAWTDEAAGVARVPVERARDLVLASGLGPMSGAAASEPAPEGDAE